MHNNYFFLGFGCSILLLSCCTVGPDYQAPQLYSDQKIHKELHLQKAQSVPENWYQQFNDNQLITLIEQGLQQNLTVKAAHNKIKQARLNLKINQVQYLPQINFQGGYTYDKYSKNIGPAINVDYYSAGFDASWEADLWGKGQRQTEADQAQLEAAAYSVDNIKIMITAEIAADYIALRQTQKKLQLAEKNLALQKDIMQTVSAKYKNGLTDDAAYQQAAYLLSSTAAQIPQYQIAAEQYRNALSLLLGVMPSDLPLDEKKQSPLFTTHYNFKTDSLYNLPADIIRRRPDVAAAERNLAAQNALIGKAIAELYPNVNISALWGYAAHNTGNLFSANSQTYSYAPLINLPLLDWNRLHNNIELQKSLKEDAFLSYQQTVLAAINEIKNASIAYQNELNSLQKNSMAAKQMQKVVQTVLRKYQNGLIEFSEVLSAQQNLINAENAVVDSKGRMLKNVIAYYKACSSVNYNSNH